MLNPTNAGKGGFRNFRFSITSESRPVPMGSGSLRENRGQFPIVNHQMNYPAAELRGIKMNFYLINPDAEHRGILLIKSPHTSPPFLSRPSCFFPTADLTSLPLK